MNFKYIWLTIIITFIGIKLVNFAYNKKNKRRNLYTHMYTQVKLLSKIQPRHCKRNNSRIKRKKVK